MNRPNDGTLWERVRIRPRFERDEIVLGAVAALALHGVFAGLLIVKVKDPAPILEETAVTKPVIGATMMKLGKPIDPKKLPDRLVPQARTAPQNRATTSRDSTTDSAANTDPNAPASRKDAGAPVPNAKDDDLLNLAAKSDPFAEKTQARPEVGDPSGTREGTATDPSQVQAGDAYAAKLGQFFRDHWQIPTVITEAQASRLCVSYAVDVSSSMQITHVGLGSLTDDPAATAMETVPVVTATPFSRSSDSTLSTPVPPAAFVQVTISAFASSGSVLSGAMTSCTGNVSAAIFVAQAVLTVIAVPLVAGDGAVTTLVVSRLACD